ncbi:MAG: DUF1329 domain-containing protein [Candidatus Binatia bacterium]
MRTVAGLFFAIGLALGVTIPCGAQQRATPGAAPTPNEEMLAKRAQEAGLRPGDVLSKDNWQLAQGLLPPEILQHYKDGEYANKIMDWPAGIYKWDPQFRAASEANEGRYTLNHEGTVVDKSTMKQPPLIYGFPFPHIDPADQNAGIKILWNYTYQNWAEGSTHNVTQLVWINPGGIDRESVQDVRFLYYDGQGEGYRLPNPNNFSQQFIAVTNSPADLNGTAALTWRYRDSVKRDSNWVYVPALRRVRAVSPANRSDGFLGSDMSQDDGPFFDGKPEDFTWKLVRQTQALRFVDPNGFEGKPNQVWIPGGGWHSVWPDMPVLGYQDPTWKGVAWAPLPAALALRPMWVIEGTPKDKYYLYGKIQLYIDKETFQGAWNRKFGWTGELLNTLQTARGQHAALKRPDGTVEWQLSSTFAFQCAENIKMHRATVAGLLPRGKNVPNDRRIHYDPKFFDATTLQRFGK